MRAKKLCLDDYLALRGESLRKFAARSGVPLSIVHRVTQGHDTSGRSWVRIGLATGGQVRPEYHWDIQESIQGELA